MSKIETVKTTPDHDRRPLHDDELEAVCGGTPETLESSVQKKRDEAGNAVIQKI